MMHVPLPQQRGSSLIQFSIQFGVFYFTSRAAMVVGSTIASTHRRIDASMRWSFAASWLTRRRRRLSASMPIVDRWTGGPPLRRCKHALRVARMREEQRVSASGVGRMRGLLATSPTNSTESCGARDAFHPKMSASSAWARVIPFMTGGNRNAHTLTTSCSGSVLCRFVTAVGFRPIACCTRWLPASLEGCARVRSTASRARGSAKRVSRMGC